jgi:hypothetical protein
MVLKERHFTMPLLSIYDLQFFAAHAFILTSLYTLIFDLILVKKVKRMVEEEITFSLEEEK